MKGRPLRPRYSEVLQSEGPAIFQDCKPVHLAPSLKLPERFTVRGLSQDTRLCAALEIEAVITHVTCRTAGSRHVPSCIVIAQCALTWKTAMHWTCHDAPKPSPECHTCSNDSNSRIGRCNGKKQRNDGWCDSSAARLSTLQALMGCMAEPEMPPTVPDDCRRTVGVMVHCPVWQATRVPAKGRR